MGVLNEKRCKDIIKYIIMSRFLKLTSIIINKNYIQHINLAEKDKIYMHIIANEVNGTILFGSGGIDSHNTKIEVCKIKQSTDYEIVNNWIKNGLN